MSDNLASNIGIVREFLAKITKILVFPRSARSELRELTSLKENAI